MNTSFTGFEDLSHRFNGGNKGDANDRANRLRFILLQNAFTNATAGQRREPPFLLELQAA